MSSPLEAYPLSWPIGWTRSRARESASFRHGQARTEKDALGRTTWRRAERLNVGQALHSRLRPELARLGAKDVVISSNVPLRIDGLPISRAREPDDPGVAVYFRLKGQPRVLACDRWDRVADNMAAIAVTIEAMRGISRWGSITADQVLGGFKALTAAEAKKPWWEVLGFGAPPSSFDAVEEKRQALALQHHPDRGGNANLMAEINAAVDEAARELGA